MKVVFNRPCVVGSRCYAIGEETELEYEHALRLIEWGSVSAAPTPQEEEPTAPTAEPITREVATRKFKTEKRA